jgi:hypothetical protein
MADREFAAEVGFDEPVPGRVITVDHPMAQAVGDLLGQHPCRFGLGHQLSIIDWQRADPVLVATSEKAWQRCANYE